MNTIESIESVEQRLRHSPKTFLVTGAAGFIGSHLVERLLSLGQHVVGLDNFSTGKPENLDDVHFTLGGDAWARFRFFEGDICEPEACRRASEGVNVVLHQAALGSVPRSIEDPATTHRVNVDGFLNAIVAARDAQVETFVYASSSSVYGDEPTLPKVESRVGRVLSPYAATKAMNESMASAFAAAYGLRTIGLRYFNVFGSRQDSNGAYAAVIPRWTQALLAGTPCTVFGDGETSRDFCPVENAVDANLLAAHAPDHASGHAFNIACGGQTTLNELHAALKDAAKSLSPAAATSTLLYEGFRKGDVAHSLANIERASAALGYVPRVDVASAMVQAVLSYAGEDAG